jgi:tRNA-specific 2-thiouridylase
MTTAVALSGGADSLFALDLIRRRGESVFAVHAFFLPPDETSREKAGQLEDICSSLGVTLYFADLSREFEREVIRPFISAYKQGLTPNPCSRCNQRIKFGLLLEHCLCLGAQRMATGHYARVSGGALWRGKDPAKDQSYFLSLVRADSLDRISLPLGEYQKQQVQAELKDTGLKPVQKKESQEVCFIPDDYREFMRQNCPDLTGPGPIIGPGNKHLGTHRGLWAYTPGQRRGLGIAYDYPLYVLEKDPVQNRLVVGPKEELNSRGCSVQEINKLVLPQKWPETVWVQTRYRQAAKPARVEIRTEQAMDIHFLAPQEKPAPGQIAAIYSDEGRVLGGGVISA